MLEDTRSALAQIPLFAGLPNEHLARLASLVTIEEHNRGDFVFEEGSQGDKLYLILKGSVRIGRRVPGMGEEALAVLRKDDYFGEMALIDNHLRSADARVHENATLLALDKKDLQDLLFVDKNVAYDVLWAFVRTLSSRLRETSNKLTFLTVCSKFD